MHHPIKELPIVENYGDRFCSRLAEWGGMSVSYETFPNGVDATALFRGLPDDMCQSPVFEEDTEILEFSPKKEYQQTIDIVARNMAAGNTTQQH